MKILLSRLSPLFALFLLITLSASNVAAQDSPRSDSPVRTAGQISVAAAEVFQTDARRIVSLGCCECLGKTTSLDLSTGQGGAATDPLWRVNGNLAYITSPFPGWFTGLSKWIQPTASATPGNVAAGNFSYVVRFMVPRCTIAMSEVRIEGKYAADNGAKVLLDGSSIASCPGIHCFKAPDAPASFAASITTPGVHTLQIDVTNEGGPSGLQVNATVRGQCKREAQ